MVTKIQDTIQFVEAETKKSLSLAAVQQSIVDLPSINEGNRPTGPIVFNIATQADEFIPWGYDVRGRDAQLRNFWPSETTLAGAVYTMAVRMAVLDWEIIGADPNKTRPKNTIAAVTRMMNGVQYGKGWNRFMAKLMLSVYTQDNGGFIEKIRAKPRPDSPVISLAVLDPQNCIRTGDPEYPVLYTDRMGREHKLPYWSVETVEDMPSDVETMYDVQVCAVSRALRSAQIIRDIMLYKREKVSGGFARAIHLVKGITRQNIDDALKYAKEQDINRALTRYTQPTLIPTIDMEGTLQHVQIDLASLPDGFDEDVTFRWYVALLANAFGVDYQEFAPLPSGALGSGQQSEILHLKSGGKGPAMMIATLENIFNNNGILPGNVIMRFKVKDSRSDESAANARYLRGRDRSLRIDSGELDVEGARRVAVDDGDMTEDLLDEMDIRDEERQQEAIDNPEQPAVGQDPLTAQQVTGGVQAGPSTKEITLPINITLPAQPAPVVNLTTPPANVLLPEQKSAPVVVNVPPPNILVNVPEQPAPVINVASPVVNVPAQEPPRVDVSVPTPNITVNVPDQPIPDVVVNIPEQPTPVVNVAPANVNVSVPESQPPNVNIMVPEQPAPVVNVGIEPVSEVLEVERDFRGKIARVIKKIGLLSK